MVSITSTFNEQANQHVFLLIMFFWISASIDADKKEEKAKKQEKGNKCSGLRPPRTQSEGDRPACTT